MAFLRNLLATILGLFIFCFLILMIFSGIAASTETVPNISKNSVLHLNLRGVVTERAIEDPFDNLFDETPPVISLIDLLYTIDYAKTDDRIEGIYLQSQFLQAGFASLQEIRDALMDFKKSGKFIYGYGEYISEGDYYLMSVCDKLYLNPEGSLEFNGLSANVTFFKGLFEKLDIEPEIFRVGDFKSYVEPYIRKDLSEENRLQLRELLSSVHGIYLDELSETKGLKLDELKDISDQMMVRLPEDAVKYGLVDGVTYEDLVLDGIRTELGIDLSDDITFSRYSDYQKAASSDKEYGSNRIAVIVANGDIVMGDSRESVGGALFAEEIRKARESRTTKAIVLRINSPGGSLTASEMIWREIQLTKGVKPIIASMSDVAASGGYYIAAPCDTIIAQPNTITGSIGIFGILFNVGDFLENKLGITNDVVTTGEFSDIITLTRSLTKEERAIIQNQVEKGYDTFISKVVDGRNMTESDVLEVAGGRVWTGEQALELGLVDKLGSFEDAIEIAADKAGISGDYRLSYYPRQIPLVEELVMKLNEGQVFGRVPNPLSGYINKLEKLERHKGIQARLPGDFKIQ